MPETISSENTQNEPSNSSPIQKENEINSSQSSNPILNKIGRFHIHQPFRGAFGGLTSFLGRGGKGKNANENGEKTIATELPEKKEKEEGKNKEINEESGEEAKEQIVRYNGEMAEEEEITNGKSNQNEIEEEEEEILQPIEILPNKANIENEGKRKEKRNENGEKMASAPQPKPSNVRFINFYPFIGIDSISPRGMLFITGENAHSREFSEEAYQLAADPKELFIMNGAGHVDLYDRIQLIPFEKLEQFYRQYL